MSSADLDASQLGNMGKNELIDMIMSLKREVSTITEEYKKLINLRFYHLERSHDMNLQYGRRDTVEITGIPTSLKMVH